MTCTDFVRNASRIVWILFVILYLYSIIYQWGSVKECHGQPLHEHYRPQPTAGICSTSTTYPSDGCNAEQPSGDAMLFTGHFAAVQGDPQTVCHHGQYKKNSLLYRANGGSTVYEHEYGKYDGASELSPGVTNATNSS